MTYVREAAYFVSYSFPALSSRTKATAEASYCSAEGEWRDVLVEPIGRQRWGDGSELHLRLQQAILEDFLGDDADAELLALFVRETEHLLRIPVSHIAAVLERGVQGALF